MDIRRFFQKKESELAEAHVSREPSPETDDSTKKEDKRADADPDPKQKEVEGGDQEHSNEEVCNTEVSDLGTPDTGPRRIKNHCFPSSMFGKQKRAFQSSWFETFEWLEYSVTADAAFCFVCRLYGKTKQTRDQKDTLNTKGYTNWKRALDSFREHEKSNLHKASMIQWKSFKSTQVHGDITEQLQSAHMSDILDRREYLKRIASVTAFLGKQGIAFRGHNESPESDNKGNFMECMQLLEKFDPFLQNYKPTSCATYLSPSSQNEMIQSTSEVIISRIISEIKEAEMFSIMVDEARDHRSEQLALCVRYVSAQGLVKERFLGFSRLDSFDARSITDTIELQLEKHEIGHLRCVAQSYDGAAVMSGAVSGVQTRFREKHPEALYIHCYAHELNLVLCATCKAIPEARDLFDLLECLYSFFSTSLLHHKKLQEFQRQLGVEARELVQLSTTRWACQVESVKATLRNLPALIEALGSISAPVAKGLENRLSQFNTIYMLVMLETLLSVTQGLHKYLQKETIDLVQALEYKMAVQSTLTSYRSNEKANEIFEKTKTLCDDLEIHPIDTQRKKRKNMDDFVVEASCGTRSNLSTGDALKGKVFFPVIDRMLEELQNRFSGVGQKILTGVQACQPASEHFLEEEALKHLAEHYSIPIKPEEIVVAKNFLQRKQGLPTIQSVYSLLDKDMFPSLKAIFQAALTIPVTSCSCERSFSALRRLHTWLRNTMGQERLSHLAVMSIEREMLADVDHGEVVDRFAKLKPRRFSLTLPAFLKKF